MRLIVLLYLLLGDITAGYFTGRSTLTDRLAWRWVLLGNVLIAALFVLGVRQSKSRGRFLGFDRKLWMLSTVICYTAGVLLNEFFGGS